MIYCEKCYYKLNEEKDVCPICSGNTKTLMLTEIVDQFNLRPRFVFAYELLPSCFQTWYMLIILFIVGYVTCINFSYDTVYIIYTFIIMFILKTFKLIFRQFKYRKVQYNVTNVGIEYINGSKGQKHFLPYEDMKAVGVKTNLATILFGYGHILVRTEKSGIYLDYIAHVDDVYEYILEHTNH